MEYRFKINESAESTLNTISWIVLFLGIIGGIIILATMSEVEVPGAYYSHTVTNPTGIALGIATIISSVMWWALFQVFINISNSLKNIYYEVKKPATANDSKSKVLEESVKPSNETVKEIDESKIDKSIKGNFMSNNDAAEFATRVKEYLEEAIANKYGKRHVQDDLEYYKRRLGDKAEEAGFNLDEIIASIKEQVGY